MICETFDIKNENSQEYARLNTYLISHSDSIKTETRPLIILCPGGGYWFTSEREGEMLALQFVAAGFHAAVLWYSVKPATFPTALLELAKSVELVRKHAKEWYVDPDKIVVEGCSAENSRYFGGIGLSSGIPGGGSEYLEGSRRSFGTGVSGSADCL